jgi:hypothetical protein
MRVLYVADLTDAGGLPTPSGDDQSLNLQFTQGLVKRLTDLSAKRYCVQSISGAALADEVNGFVLEGSLSHVTSGTSEGGSYLCTLVLRGTGKNHDLVVAHWSAIARSYIDLTNNLSHDPRVNPEGMIGELTSRVNSIIVASTAGNQTRLFNDFLTKSLRNHAIEAELVSGLPNAKGKRRPVLSSGDSFRVRIATRDAGTVFLVGFDSNGRPITIAVPETSGEIRINPSHSALVPSRNAIPTGTVEQPTNRRIVVLIRRAGVTSRLAESSPMGLIDAGSASIPAVQVLSSAISVPLSESSDSGVARILAMAATDTPGTWLATEVTVRIQPKKTTHPR